MQTPTPNFPVRKKSKNRNIIIIILVALAVIIGGSLLRRGSSNSSGGDDTQYLETAARANGTKVSAKDLYAAYENNEIGADQTYKNKMLQVSGIITSIGTDITDDPYVVLDNNVQCVMQNKDGLADLSKSQFITITGVCEGKTINVILRKGQIFY